MDKPAVDMDRSNSSALAGFKELRSYLNAQILGQESLVESMLVALLAEGHLLMGVLSH